MPDERKKPLHPETIFLPPLDMVLSFFNKKEKPAVADNESQASEEVQGHAVKRITNTSRTMNNRLKNWKTKRLANQLW